MDPAPNLKLLLATRETIPVLCYISSHPKASPNASIKVLRIGLKTWYAAILALEDLGLVVGVRPLGGKKIRYFALTREGKEAMTALSAISLVVGKSKGVLRVKLGKIDRAQEPRRVGEIICELLLLAERAADRKEIVGLISLAKDEGRELEATLGAAQLAFLSGEADVALERVKEGLTRLDRSTMSNTHLKLLQLKAASLENCGEPEASAKAWHEFRRVAKKCGNLEMVVEAHVGLGVLLARRSQLPDAIREFNKGLDTAHQARLPPKEAKALSNLAMAEFLLDPDAGLARSNEALQAALSSGATLTLGWVRANRGLMFAYKGDRSIAQRELKEARRLFEQMGNERGMAAFEGWAGLVKETLELHQHESPEDFRNLVLRSIRLPPSSKPEGRPGSRPDPSPSE